MSIHAFPQRNSVPIVTLTMNTCLDITTSVDQVRPTDKLRAGLPD